MTSRTLTAGVAAGCIMAAGVGGFLAVRTASDPAPVAALSGPASQVDVAGPARATDEPPASDVVAAPPVTARRPPTSTPTTVERPRQTLSSPASATSPVATPQPPDAAVPGPEMSLALDAPLSANAVLPVHPGPSVMLEEPRVSMVELPANTVIGFRLDTTVSTESARVEDPVEARVTRPVVVDGETVIPTGARLRGHVTLVEVGGRFRERARVAIRFTSLALGDDTQVPIVTEAIYREGDAPAGEATAKIGASAVVGSILGGVFGGKRGAAIGAATGAAGGTAVVAAGERSEATMLSGSTFTVRLAEAAMIALPR